MQKLLTLSDFLNYEPESIHWKEDNMLPGSLSLSSSSTDATNSRDPQENHLKVRSWHSFIDDVNNFVSKPPFSLASAVLQGSLPKREHDQSYRVRTEMSVVLKLDKYVFQPLHELFSTQDPIVLFDDPGHSALLNADYGIYTVSSDAPQTSVLKSVVEVKSPWAFPSVPGGDLAAMFCQLQGTSNLKDLVDKSSASTKVIRAVTQLWGYMSVNHFRYGVLTTYCDTYFVRRVELDRQSCVEISPAILNKGGEVNVIAAWAFFITLLEKDPVYSSPYSTPEMKRRVIDQRIQDKYVPVGITLGDLYFEEKFSFGATGNVVFGRPRVQTLKSAFDDNTRYAIKLIDSTKVLNAKDIFYKEIEAYKRLESLQGKVIPAFKGAFVASDFMFVIILEDCGDKATKQDLVNHLEQLRVHFQEIHALGVVQGDVARRNIVVRQGHLYVIDFGYCTFQKDNENTFEQLCKEEMETVLKLQSE
jgi:hypothetical protein